MSYALSESGDCDDDKAKALASKLLSEEFDIAGFIAPCVFGNSNSQEIIIISKKHLDEINIKEISKSDLSSNYDHEDRLDY